MKPVSFKLDISPLGINNVYSQGYNGRRFLTQKGKEYKDTLGWAATKAKPAVFFLCPKVTLIFTFGDNRKRDIDGPIKLTLDALTGVLWEDDSRVEELHVFKRIAPKKPSIEVTVEEL